MRLVLKYRSGCFRVDIDLMKPPPAKMDTLRKLAESLQKEGILFEPGFVPPKTWAKILGLFYTGHAPLARKFFNKTLPKNIEGKRKFLAAFRKRLRESPYWPAVPTQVTVT